MAQNIDPYYSQQSDNSKQNNEGRNVASESHAVTKRLHKELMTLVTSTDKSVSAFPEGENLFRWIGTITGPSDTVYESQKYKLSLEFPHSYPYTPPAVKFITPCFHPNIDSSGTICLDVLKEKWSALYDVRTILLSIQSLLGEPNIDSPLNSLAAELWTRQAEYKRHVLETYNQL